MHFSHHVNTNDYTLQIAPDGRRIQRVLNKHMNAEIEFQGISTDFEAMARMEVYTTIITRSFGNQEVQLVNIVHLHFNTASEDTTIEAVYLEGGQTKHDHIEFGTDAAGRPLKYKILVRDK